MTTILYDIYQKIKFSTYGKDIKQIQEHNLEVYLKSICDINSRLLYYLVLTKEYNECLQKKDDCKRQNAELESCKTMREEVTMIFKNRQYNYFEKLREEKG
jgi:hypothetical protein